MKVYSMTEVSPRYYTVAPMLLPSGNPFKCHDEVLYLQPMIPPKRLTFYPLTGGCSEGLDAFRVSVKYTILESNTRWRITMDMRVFF